MSTSKLKFEKIGIEEREVLLDCLGYEIDETGLIIVKKTKEAYKDPLFGNYTFIENASILPGSTIIVDTSEISLAEYLTRYVDEGEDGD